MPPGMEQTLDIPVSQTVADVKEIGEDVQSTPQTRKLKNRIERSAVACLVCEGPTSSIEEDMCDECEDEDLLIHSCEACIWHACGPCTRLKQLRLRLSWRAFMTVVPIADSCGVPDVIPFGALHSASKGREREVAYKLDRHRTGPACCWTPHQRSHLTWRETHILPRSSNDWNWSKTWVGLNDLLVPTTAQHFCSFCHSDN